MLNRGVGFMPLQLCKISFPIVAFPAGIREAGIVRATETKRWGQRPFTAIVILCPDIASSEAAKQCKSPGLYRAYLQAL